MNDSYYFILIIFILIISILILFIYNYAYNSPYQLSAQDAKIKIKQNFFNIILDIRTNIERNTIGYYKGSIHIQENNLEKYIYEKIPNKNATILVYSNYIFNSRKIVDKLHKLGYSNTFYITSSYKNLL